MQYNLYTLDNKLIKKTYLVTYDFSGIIKFKNGIKEYYLDGKLHRLDGPAVECSDVLKEWYVDGKQGIEEQCKCLHDIMKLRKITC